MERISVNKWFNLLVFIALVSLVSCDNDDDSGNNSIESTNLQEYLDNLEIPKSTGLVACAAGNLSLDNLPLTMFYRSQLNGFTDLRYYESESHNIDSSDFSNYTQVAIENQSLFNGFMGKFERPTPEIEKWAVVTYKANDTLWYCDPVKIEVLSKPTAKPNNLISIDQSEPLNPVFTWIDNPPTENVIYYQLIVDATTNDAISGTYTTDLNWQFYDLSNVVFNVTNPGAEPELLPNKPYKMIMMGVSEDNWVNLFGEIEFTTN